MGKTLADKVWESHVVRRASGEPDLLYIDLHVLHEVNTPQAFDVLRAAGRTVRRPDLTLATEDHAVPTRGPLQRVGEPGSQVDALRRNCKEYDIELHSVGDASNGIVHVIAPELGLAQPGMVCVCCDSHTATLGAFGALAFGIGSSQVEHVLATQTLPLEPMQNMAVTVNNTLPIEVSAKDLILNVINKIGTAGGVGHVIEYRGEAIDSLSMEGRMTVANMSVEGGAKAGMIGPDQKTFDYLRGLPHVPQGAAFDAEVEHWKSFVTDEDAEFDKEVELDARTMKPFVSWGTNPAQSVSLDAVVPNPRDLADHVARDAGTRALSYMDLKPGTRMRDIDVDVVFIGSCTNSRIEDLRAAAEVLKGRRVSASVALIVVPGSNAVRAQAIEEGLDRIFQDAGSELRWAGCSYCTALNEDRIPAGKRAASTTNRNFEGRQGRGSRTHLVSPAVAAATAVAGRLAAPDDLTR